MSQQSRPGAGLPGIILSIVGLTGWLASMTLALVEGKRPDMLLAGAIVVTAALFFTGLRLLRAGKEAS